MKEMETQDTIAVDRKILTDMLLPYKKHCRYLKYAASDCFGNTQTSNLLGDKSFLLSGSGEFGIPESCYIDDTGHFNAVEFNICYNQLAYVLLAHWTVNNRIEPLKGVSFEKFRQNQLSNMLIADLSSSFKKAIQSEHFYGRFAVKKISVRSRVIFLKTHCEFYDGDEGTAEGNVLLAFIRMMEDASRERKEAAWV